MNLFGNEETPRGQTVDAGFGRVTRGVRRSLANGRNQRGMRAVRAGRSGVGRGYGEMVEAAFNVIGGSRRSRGRVIRLAGGLHGCTSRHTRRLVRPFGFACRNGDIAEPVAGHATNATA